MEDKKRLSLTRRLSTLILGKKNKDKESHSDSESSPNGSRSSSPKKTRRNSKSGTPSGSPRSESPVHRRPSVSLSKEALIASNIIQEKSDSPKTNLKTEQLRFGVSLGSLIEEGREIPLLVLKTTSSLHKMMDTPGLFFADTENNVEVQSVRGLIEKGKVEISDISDPHVLAGLLKLFFVELPEPLFTFQLYDGFIFASNITDKKYKTNILRSVVYNLPTRNRVLLQYLLSFFKKVNGYSDKNRMDANKLGKCFGPILIRSK